MNASLASAYIPGVTLVTNRAFRGFGGDLFPCKFCIISQVMHVSSQVFAYSRRFLSIPAGFCPFSQVFAYSRRFLLILAGFCLFSQVLSLCLSGPSFSYATFVLCHFMSVPPLSVSCSGFMGPVPFSFLSVVSSALLGRDLPALALRYVCETLLSLLFGSSRFPPHFASSM